MLDKEIKKINKRIFGDMEKLYSLISKESVKGRIVNDKTKLQVMLSFWIIQGKISYFKPYLVSEILGAYDHLTEVIDNINFDNIEDDLLSYKRTIYKHVDSQNVS